MTSRLQPSDVVASFMSAVQDPKKRLDQDYREMALRDLVTMLESNEIEFDTPEGVFRDCLHLPDDHTFTEAELTTMAQERLAAWMAMFSNPSN